MGLTETELLKRLGFRNLDKGRKRLADFASAEGLKGIEHLVRPLARELCVEKAQIEEAIQETWDIAHDREFARYAANFYPHAILRTERTVPSQITFAAMCGADKWRVIEFNEGSPPTSYARQVMNDLPEIVPFFGPVTGFWVNFAPDRAVEFDRAGNPVKSLDRAVRIGRLVGQRLPGLG